MKTQLAKKLKGLNWAVFSIVLLHWLLAYSCLKTGIPVLCNLVSTCHRRTKKRWYLKNIHLHGSTSASIPFRPGHNVTYSHAWARALFKPARLNFNSIRRWHQQPYYHLRHHRTNSLIHIHNIILYIGGFLQWSCKILCMEHVKERKRIEKWVAATHPK